jgi:DNA invertase Pin-like site-specific DNA recombinase
LQLVSSFETYGCHVISIQESWTQDTRPMRELFIAMAAWAGKFESDRRSERTKAGLDRARANGKRLGRPLGKKDSKPRRKKRPVVFRYGGASVEAATQ